MTYCSSYLIYLRALVALSISARYELKEFIEPLVKIV